VEPGLTVVGTGLLPGLHLTRETEHLIATADRVLFLVADTITTKVIEELRGDAESLLPYYHDARKTGDDRSILYDRIVRHIVDTVQGGHNTCAIFYGHPGVFSSVAHDSMHHVEELGFAARMTPAISAEDCLFSDLGVDPGLPGCQSYEATYLIVKRPNIERRAHLIVWQIGVVGRSDVVVASEAPSHDPASIDMARSLLVEVYGGDHPATLYTASTLPGIPSETTGIELGDLGHTGIPPMATLYVPPQDA
jgi:uroporphyrin-III C-methyltransferase